MPGKTTILRLLPTIPFATLRLPAYALGNSSARMGVILVFLIWASACKQVSKVPVADTEEWQSLFNGKDLTGWQIKIAGYPLRENYNETFVAEDSMIRIRYDRYETFGDAFGHMYYEKPYSHYKLRFDYRFTGDQLTGGASWNIRNSGVMLHSQSAASNEFGQDFPVSVEMQLLGGLGEGERTTANVCTPGTAVEINDEINYNHCIPSESATYDGDQWVHAEAVVLGGDAMYFLVEGDTVLQFQHPQVGGGFVNEQDQVEDWKSFGVERDMEDWVSRSGEILKSGYIALQAESHPIDFKNIELLNLCGCMDPEAKNYRSYYIKNDQGSCEY
jgi:hypothetical protein